MLCASIEARLRQACLLRHSGAMALRQQWRRFLKCIIHLMTSKLVILKVELYFVCCRKCLESHVSPRYNVFSGSGGLRSGSSLTLPLQQQREPGSKAHLLAPHNVHCPDMPPRLVVIAREGSYLWAASEGCFVLCAVECCLAVLACCGLVGRGTR